MLYVKIESDMAGSRASRQAKRDGRREGEGVSNEIKKNYIQIENLLMYEIHIWHRNLLIETANICTDTQHTRTH